MQKLVPEQYWTFLVYAKRKKQYHSHMGLRLIVHDSVLILFRTEKNSNFTYGRVLMSKYNGNQYWNQEIQTRTMVKRLIRRRTPGRRTTCSLNENVTLRDSISVTVVWIVRRIISTSILYTTCLVPRAESNERIRWMALIFLISNYANANSKKVTSSAA